MILRHLRVPRRPLWPPAPWATKQNRQLLSSVSSPSLGSTFNGSTVFNQWMPSLSSAKPGGLLSFPELTDHTGFAQMEEDCLRNSDILVREALSPAGEGRDRMVARVFDDLSDELCRVADLAEFVRLSHPDPRFRQSAEQACISVSNQVEKFNTDRGLYDALRNVSLDKSDSFPQSEVDRHVSKLFLLDFQQCGIHLDDTSRDKVVTLNDQILQLGQAFSANAFVPTTINTSAVPNHLQSHFPLQGNQLVISHPQSDNHSERIREVAYKLYHTATHQQEQILQHLLERRRQLAEICGYSSYAQRATLGSLAQDPETVNSFLAQLSTSLKPRMAEDFQAMLGLKRKSPVGGSASDLEVWDLAHLSNQARHRWCADVDMVAVSAYFSLGACMEGLDQLYRTLFNVYLEVETPTEGELWHPNVYKLSVKDVADDAELGTIYCDFFTRKDKPHQDCHFAVRGGRMTRTGAYQNPVVVVMLNMPPPGLAKPTLLSPHMIDNLFHEMGHAMHSMLARTEYQHVTGTRCSTDFAEVPSTLMEYFSSDPRVLQSISRHHRTNEKIPMDVIEKVCASKKIFASSDLHRQTMFSLLDQEFHSESPLGDGDSTTETLQRVHESHHLLKYHQGVAWHLRFSHLVGYGARYYSYLMARAVASRIWQQYFQEEPFNTDSGARYRQECLSHGGGKPSRSLVSDFLGKPLDAEMMAQSLISEVDVKNKLVNDLLIKKR